MPKLTRYIMLVLLLLTANRTFSQQNDTLRYFEQVAGRFREQKEVLVLPSDTTYLCIFVKDRVTTVKLKGKLHRLEKTTDLSKFIRANKGEIIKNKILVVAPASTKYADYHFILDALKENDLMLFKLVSTDH